MPIYSKAQQGFMFANHPAIAKKMADRMKGKSGIKGRRGKVSKSHPLKGIPARTRNGKAVRSSRRAGRKR